LGTASRPSAVAVVYRTLSGIATLVGGLRVAICFRLFNPESPFGMSELSTYAQSLAGASPMPLSALFSCCWSLWRGGCDHRYVASPAILTIDEMASGCQRKPRAPVAARTPATLSA